MAITTYTELKTAVANWLNRDDLTSYIPDFITLAESRMYEGTDKFGPLLLRNMETASDLTINAQTVACPTGFLSAKRLYLDTVDKPVVRYVVPEVLWGEYTYNGTDEPSVFTIEGTNFVFGPSPDATYTGKLLYWAKFDALSDSVASNWLLENAPNLYLYGALLEAEPFIKNDERLTVWATMFTAGLERLQSRDRQDWNYGGKLVASAGYKP